MTNKTETVKIENISAGDTVLINGEMRTVGNQHIKHNELFGYTIFGEPLRNVERVLFRKWYCGEVVAWLPQI